MGLVRLDGHAVKGLSTHFISPRPILDRQTELWRKKVVNFLFWATVSLLPTSRKSPQGPIPTSEPFSQMQNILKYHMDICEFSEVGSRVLWQKVPMMILNTILRDKMNT